MLLVKAFVIAAVVVHGLLAHPCCWRCFRSRQKPHNLGGDDDDFLVIADKSEIHLQPRQQLWMHMYAANEQAPKNSACRGHDAYVISHQKQIFTINDAGSSMFQSLRSQNSISRILARAIVLSFSRTSEWRSSMRSAIKTAQEQGGSGTTTALVVRKLLLTNRNVVAIYSLGDSRVAHLRQRRSTKLYKVLSVTQIQRTREGPFRISANETLTKVFGIDDMEEYNFDVEDNDLIIGASNGLWDVVNESEIAHVANRAALDALALSLAKLASNRGPNDDVTVVVAHITQQQPTQPMYDQDNLRIDWGESSSQPVVTNPNNIQL